MDKRTIGLLQEALDDSGLIHRNYIGLRGNLKDILEKDYRFKPEEGYYTYSFQESKEVVDPLEAQDCIKIVFYICLTQDNRGLEVGCWVYSYFDFHSIAIGMESSLHHETLLPLYWMNEDNTHTLHRNIRSKIDDLIKGALIAYELKDRRMYK